MGGGMSIEMWRAEDDDGAVRSALQNKVFEELEWEPGLDTRDLKVSVTDTAVVLYGTVRRYPAKVAIERAARRVHGVQSVRNDLVVTPPPGDRRSDDEIAREARVALADNVIVAPEHLQVSVARGVVELRGQAETYSARCAAEEAVERLMGVTGVTNLVVLKAVPPVPGIEAHVSAALKHACGAAGRRIHVSASEGSVTLRGRARCLADRDRAVRAAWDVPGVTAIVDELEIKG